MFEQPLATLGWVDTTLRADEQPDTELRLQVGDMLTERRLGNAQLAGRT
jgi:hypothetical protein